ncbi:MAG: GntR family transcriptional regulator [Acidobacteria bacterium]|nr:GntR family transcriptional regulator [Acidobacteriota bacterium]NIM60273.1 GntR family transcriptional regulator [Acidobacteriota bacterium]NIO57876.1 GntR family transcriptional regulator [Acidobacteriota bacterium]NIQ28885.1 GntR family transcriptional regulator [Acidobacteriota bacterium]NIQ83343.1 GntR family transcriptional regulator [Acidobacteriota bacterium]
MAASPNPRTGKSGLERVRHELLTALHFGKLSPGDRAPSVRRLADLTGMNRKTIHRAYTRLANEGFLDLRPGSGTYIAESAPVNDLLGAVSRCRATARDLGLEASVFSSFLDIYLSGGLRELPLAVVECNREQVGLIAAALRVELGIAPRPLLLSKLSAEPRSSVEGCWGIVTTDGHRAEIRAVSPPVPVFRVAFDPTFPMQLAEQAERGPVIMVVHDRAFAGIFARMLRQMAVAPEVIRRFSFFEPSQARAALARCTGRASIYVSPLLPPQSLGPMPVNVQPIRGRWRIEPASLERLKAALALDVANRRGAAGARTAV